MSTTPGAGDSEQQPQPPQQQPQQQPQAGSGALEPQVGNLVAYLLGFVTGLILYFTQSDREIRFHAAQSTITFGGIFVLQIVLVILSAFLAAIFGPLSLLIWLLQMLVGLATFVLWIMLMIKGYNREHYKLPIVGDMAEQWAAK